MIYNAKQRKKQANAIKGKGNPHWKGGRISKYCVRCGTSFLVYPNRKDSQTHCSLACANRDMADKQRGVPCLSKGRSQSHNPRLEFRGELNPNWKGGQHVSQGYVMVYFPQHPHTNGRGYVKRANLVLEEKLGRYLLPDMIAHHLNKIRDDDKPENLIEMSNSKHMALHRTKEATWVD